MALLDDLIAHWKLDDSGATWIDSHAANDLTNSGGASVSGKLGTAFDGSGAITSYVGFLYAEDNADLSAGDFDFTWACWVNIYTEDNYHILFCKHAASLTGNEDFEYRLYYDPTIDRFVFDVGNGTTGATVVADTFGAPAMEIWYFIVCKHDSVGNEISIKVNDGTADTESYSGGSYDSDYRFYVCGQGDSPLAVAIVDSLSFWARLTTTEEDTELYNAGAGLDYDDWPVAAPPITYALKHGATAGTVWRLHPT